MRFVKMVIMLTAGLLALWSLAPATAQINGKPATWIADRKLKGWAFIDDLGASLPDDQIRNDVAQEIKRLTGITLEWRYNAGTSDQDVLMVALAAGDLPSITWTTPAVPSSREPSTSSI